MPWFKVDDGFHSHPKTIGLSLEARGLWVTAGSWCAHHLTDGVLNLAHVRFLGGSEELAAELVESGLWITHKKGYRFHEWTEYQPTRDDVESERAAARERMRNRRQKKKTPGQTDNRSADVRANIAGTSDEVREVFGNPDPTRPDPTSKEVEGGAKRASKRRLSDDFQASEAHASKAKELGVSLPLELEKFKNHFIGNGDTKADWSRTFHNWITRAAEYSNGRSRLQPQPSFDPWAQDWSEDDIRKGKQ